MRNLYISTYPARYRVDLCNVLAERLDCDIYHYVPVENEADILRCARYENRRLPVGKFCGKPYAKGLKALLETAQPSFVLVQEFSLITLQLLLWRKRFGYRVVSICDDSMDLIRNRDFGWLHRLARLFVPAWLDDLVVSTPAVRDWYRNRFGKGQLMPILADERRILPALERALPASERLRPGDKPIVAFVGRLVDLKNIPTLIHAFAPFRDRAQLVIIGDGPNRPQLESLAPYAVFPGMLAEDDLLAWYNLIDVLVLPSFQEAYGAVTSEALMAGAKVIVTRTAGSADLVREGENGFLVDPTDVAGLTDRIDRLLERAGSARPLTRRENLHPYRFADYAEKLVEFLKGL